MSPAEEFLQKHSQWQMENTLNELNTLRGASSQFRLRPRFLVRATQVLSALSPADKLEVQESLDSGKRSKVIADVVRKLENEWRQWIKDTFFPDSEKWGRFDNTFSEQPYTKNTVGILREVAWQASHGQNGTLTNRVLADITWSIWNALRGSIRGALDRDLTQDELGQVADKVCEIQQPLTQLWIETVRNSKGGKAREGVLVGQWKQEDAKRAASMIELRTRGVDCKWDPRPVTVKPSERAINTKEIRELLAHSLFFHVQKV